MSVSEGNAYTSAGREGNAHAYRRGLGGRAVSALLFHLASRARGPYEPFSPFLITLPNRKKNRDLEN